MGLIRVGEINVAGPGLSAVAGFIDFVVVIAIGWVFGLAFGQTTEDGFNLSGGPAFRAFALMLAYYIVMEAMFGATLGRLGDMVAGTLVVRRS